jgi:hypothetical protein
MTQITVSMSDPDLLARMRNFEDHLVERKTVKDEKDWKKTAVAFANSVPIGLPAVLYIGVRDNGEIETPQQDLDEVEKKFNRQMSKVYPRIAYVPKILSENGRQALAVVIPGSALRPHFAGLAYVRRGSESIEASDEQFAELIAHRNSKAARILAWKDKQITLVQLAPSSRPGFGMIRKVWKPELSILVSNCDQFYVTLQVGTGAQNLSFPLGQVEISFDNGNHRLQLELQP